MDEKLDDVMRRLSQDPKYQEMKRQQEEKRQFFKKLLQKDEKDLVTELRANGRFVDSVWDLVNSENDYDECLPILVSHLKKSHHPRVTEGIVRALSIPSAIGDDIIWTALCDLFPQVPEDHDIEDPGRRGLKFAIINALNTIADESRLPELKRIVAEHKSVDGIDLLQKKVDQLI